MANNTSQHILNTAANLLVFCLFVITSLHVSNTAEAIIIDEITSVIALLLTFSRSFTFLSIRTKNQERERRFETITDHLFFSSLAGISLIIVLLVFNFIK